MSKKGSYRQRFADRPWMKDPIGKKRKPDVSLDDLIQMVGGTSVDAVSPDDLDLGDLNALSRKKAIKAIRNGKVLNTKRKKFKRWRKQDKKILKILLRDRMDSLVQADVIGKRKARKLRKTVVKRILSCFYAKED